MLDKMNETIIPPEGEGWGLVETKIFSETNPSDYRTSSSPRLKDQESKLLNYTRIGTVLDKNSFVGGFSFLKPYPGAVMKTRYCMSPYEEPGRGEFPQTFSLLVSEKTFIERCNARFDSMPYAFDDKYIFRQYNRHIEPIEIGYSPVDFAKEFQIIQEMRDLFAGKEGTLTSLLSYILDNKKPIWINDPSDKEKDTLDFIQKISLLIPPEERPTFATNMQSSSLYKKVQLFTIDKGINALGLTQEVAPFSARDTGFPLKGDRSNYIRGGRGEKLVKQLYTETPENYRKSIWLR